MFAQKSGRDGVMCILRKAGWIAHLVTKHELRDLFFFLLFLVKAIKMEVRLFKIWSIDTITHNKIVDLALDQYCKIAFAMRR